MKLEMEAEAAKTGRDFMRSLLVPFGLTFLIAASVVLGSRWLRAEGAEDRRFDRGRSDAVLDGDTSGKFP